SVPASVTDSSTVPPSGLRARAGVAVGGAGFGATRPGGSAAEGIKMTALARVGQPRQHNSERLRVQRPLIELLRDERDLGQGPAEAFQQVCFVDKANVLLAEIESGLHFGQQVQQIVAESLKRPAHATGQLSH